MKPEEERIGIVLSGGPVLVDDIGDVILSIEIPGDEVAQYEVHEDPPEGWPFREYWLPPYIANAYRSTLKVFISASGEEFDPALLRGDHAVLVTERFSAFPTETGEAAPVGAVCVCGERWRWRGGDEDPRAAFPDWAADHARAAEEAD
jgi:hypothetical protein